MKIKSLAVALMGLACFAGSLNAQMINNDPGLLLGFRASGGTGSDRSVVFALGPIETILSGGSYTLDLSGAGSILTQTYGNAWYSRSDLYWGVLGYNNGFVDGSPTLADVWLSRSAGSPYPTVYGEVALGTESLAGIGNSYANIQVASLQGNATLGTVVGSNGVSLQSSAYANANSGSWQSQAINGWGLFPSPTDSALSSGLAVSYYTSDLGTLAGIYPVDAGFSIAQANGVVTVDVIPEPSTYALMGFGGLFLVIAYRKRMAKKATV